MRQFFTGLCVVLLCGYAFATPDFPALTGRIVDNAHILSPSVVQPLEQELAGYEQSTGNQVIVTTVPSLDGMAIEEYGVELGRHWHIGQKGQDNGVLLIVAPKEQQVRIEVGYGLEGQLTDAASSQIINTVILPDFRAGNMGKGVVDGTHAIVSALGGTAAPVPQPHYSSSPIQAWHILLVLLGIVFYIWLCITHPDIAWFLFRVAMCFGGGGGSSRSGGFDGGGGGSFGGGGASGRW
jgi:uncharacterized protein